MRVAGKFGRTPKRDDARTLQFAKYAVVLPAPPPGYSSYQRVLSKLNLGWPQIPELYPMDGNDTVGDCTIAALAHCDTTFSGIVGQNSIMAQADVLALYFQLTGGQDTGLNELDVLNYWRGYKLGNTQVYAYVSVDPKNHEHVKQAISMFDMVYTGFNVPNNCLDEFNAGEPWANPNGFSGDGHAVPFGSYSADMLRCLTWGATQLATWDWWDTCVEECYALLPTEAGQEGFNIEGFDLAQLQSDLAAVTA